MVANDHNYYSQVVQVLHSDKIDYEHRLHSSGFAGCKSYSVPV